MRGIDPAATKGRERDASPLPANCTGDEHRETIRLNCPGSIAPVELPREAASGSAGTQPDKEYPGLRCANGASDPWKLVLPGVVLISMLDIGGMPLKILRRSRTKTPLGWLGTLQPDEPPSVEPQLNRIRTLFTHEFR